MHTKALLYSASFHLMNNDHSAEKMRICFAVKLFLDARVVYKDQRAYLKILILNSRGEMLDKFGSRLFPGLQDSG